MSKQAFTPEEILPAGDDYAIIVNPFTRASGKARKGTVAATLNNIALLERLLLDNTQLEQIRQIDEEITKLLSSLKVIGVFDLFNFHEWVNDDQRLGRIYVVALYLKHNPQEMTQQLMSALKRIKQTTKSVPLKSLLEEIAP